MLCTINSTVKENKRMELKRMSNISRISAIATAKEFVDMTAEKVSDSLQHVQEIEQALYTMKEALNEAQLQMNNAIFEDCM